MTAILPLLEITAIMRNKSGGEHARRLSRAWTGSGGTMGGAD